MVYLLRTDASSPTSVANNGTQKKQQRTARRVEGKSGTMCGHRYRTVVIPLALRYRIKQPNGTKVGRLVPLKMRRDAVHFLENCLSNVTWLVVIALRRALRAVRLHQVAETLGTKPAQLDFSCRVLPSKYVVKQCYVCIPWYAPYYSSVQQTASNCTKCTRKKSLKHVLLLLLQLWQTVYELTNVFPLYVHAIL